MEEKKGIKAKKMEDIVILFPCFMALMTAKKVRKKQGNFKGPGRFSSVAIIYTPACTCWLRFEGSTSLKLPSSLASEI